MNILLVLYAGPGCNSFVHLALHASELHRRGHRCAVAVPSGVEEATASDHPHLRVLGYAEALADPAAIFADGRAADVLHAWTPREGVRRFITSYLVRQPTPWIVYLEDNERWISSVALSLVGVHEGVLHQHSEEVISTWTPDGISHALRFESFIGLADGAAVIQDNLAGEVPPWVACTTVLPGVDLDLFSPRAADPAVAVRHGVAEGERVIVYAGGLNDFTRPGLEALCRAVGLLNLQGTRCRLLRTGPVALDFLDRLPVQAAAVVTELGVVPRGELPAILALADVFVQPGKPDAFEDLRLPAKLPEFFAMGRPVVLPEANIARLLHDGVNAVLHRTGSAEEIAEKCIALFADPSRARRIGEAGRHFAETHFNPATQAARLEGVYFAACDATDRRVAAKLWEGGVEDMEPSALLARKLRLLAAAGGAGAVASASMLRAHARSIEFALERWRGLETGMAVRDQQIETLKAEVESLNGEVGTRDGHITALQRGIAEINGALAAAQERIAQRERHITAVESSLIWRVTRPLRIAGELARRLLSHFRLPPDS